jgi:hypothetical protein
LCKFQDPKYLPTVDLDGTWKTGFQLEEWSLKNEVVKLSHPPNPGLATKTQITNMPYGFDP